VSTLPLTYDLGEATVTVNFVGRTEDSENRPVYFWRIALGEEDGYYSEHGWDLYGGAHSKASPIEGMSALLSFLGAAGESYAHSGIEGENAGLFTSRIVEWASRNQDEIAMLALEVGGDTDE